MSDLKAVVLGTNDYHAVMQSAVMNSLQRQAGYIAPKLTEAFEAVPGLRPYLYPVDTISNISFVWKWSNGRGWICGSAALWTYSGSRDEQGTKWMYRDIDVFAHDETAFESLKADMHDAWSISDHDRSYKAEGVNLDGFHVGTVNVICPPPGVSWENPMHVWESFDLNVAQCLIVSPEWVAVVGDLALVHWDFSDDDKRPFLSPKGNLKSAARFAERVQRYVSRGFRLASDFWHTVYNQAEKQGQKQATEFESIIRFIHNLDDGNSISTMRGGGLPDLIEYFDDEGTTDSYEQEYYDDDDDGYWHS